MGILDKLKRVKKDSGDAIADGVEKATDVVDEKTDGKYTEHLDKVDDAADKLRNQDET